MSYRIDEPRTSYPFADTRAAMMLSEGLKRANRDRGLSLRSIAKLLGYKQATVLSHMANGRVAIPIERAPDIARIVGLPPADLLAAAVEQRSSEAANLLPIYQNLARADDQGIAFELKLIAGHEIDELNAEQKAVLREVVVDHSPSRRWLNVAELPVMLMLRQLRPDISSNGLSIKDREAIERALFPHKR